MADEQLSTLGSVIKTAYEAEADTNAYTDSEKTIVGNTSGTNTGDEAAASTTVAGVAELATVAEIDTGTDNVRAVTPLGLAGSALQTTVDAIETGYIGQNLQTGTAYTLVLGDAGKLVEMNNASANTLTIPANSSVAFPVDTRIDINQHGAGLTTVVITTDTLRGDAVSVGQYKGLSLWKRTSTEWVIYGGTTA